MKKADRYILRSFLGPLLLTFSIAIFVLLMQFVWKYIDDMVGKGLDFGIILQLLFYAAATFVPMALPIAVLFASIMTMGNLGEKYELVALKAGGIPVWRIMMPMAVVVLLLTGTAFYFANNIMPVAMLKYKSTLFDVTRKKPALNIKPSEYYTELDGYVIRIDHKASDGRTLQGILIYDQTKTSMQQTVIVADSGSMQTTPDDRTLLLTLHHGHIYTERYDGRNRNTRPFTTIDFDKQVISFDLSSFAFNKSDQDFFKGNYQMMNISQLMESAHQLETTQEQRYAEFATDMDKKLQWLARLKHPTADLTTTATAADNSLAPDSLLFATLDESYEPPLASSTDTATVPPPFHPDLMQTVDSTLRYNIVNSAISRCQSAMTDIAMYGTITESDEEFINRHYIEWHRKFTLSVACIVLFLIGAPFGSIVRKGGLGVPLVASVLFFVVYYMIGMIAEKSVRESAIQPAGMWISTLVLLPIGLLLTVEATSDAKIFDPATWRNLLGRRSRSQRHSAHSTAPSPQQDTSNTPQ